VVGAFGGGPEEVELGVAVELARVDGIDAGAEGAGVGVVCEVGVDGDGPVVDGGEVGGVAEG
jgi:hypothetical protein